MYKVINIQKCAVTNFIQLYNLTTKTIDICFDDSSLMGFHKGQNDFEFMKENGIYNCKIELFGKFESKKTDDNVEVKLIESGVVIGNTKYFKVLIKNDEYYILESDADGLEIKEKMYYHFTRKDLIQVDDVIHADCL